MAKSQIKLNDHVKLTVDGQPVFGKVVKAEEGSATILLPTGAEYSFATDKVAFDVIKEEEYTAAVKTLLEQIAKSVDIDINGIQEKSKNLESKNAEIQSKLDEIQKQFDEVSAKLADIEAEKVAASRVASLKACEGLDLVDEDHVKASASIKKMTSEEFDKILKMAEKAFKKLTEVRQTSLPALTDQTKTGETKLTEAEIKELEERKAKEAAEALAKSEAEKKESVANAGVNEEPENALAQLFEKRLENRKKVKKSK